MVASVRACICSTGSSALGAGGSGGRVRTVRRGRYFSTASMTAPESTHGGAGSNAMSAAPVASLLAS